jgi:FkbM family methyltransferase
VSIDSPVADLLPAAPRLRLPNGMTVIPQSRVEAEHFYDDLFEKRIYARHGVRLRPGACVFDVGGNIGMFTLWAHRHAPGARIFTFEPAPPLFERIQANLRLNGARARVFNHGISDAERTAAFTFYPNSSGMSSFYADAEEEREVLRAMMRHQRAEGMEGLDALLEYTDELLDERFRAVEMECRLRPLSAVIREEGVARIDLLKIDVQKAEMDVLRGIDDEHWPLIGQVVMEVHDLDGRLDAVRRLLEARGFGVAVEQDEAVEGSILYNLFAVRPAAEQASAEGAPVDTAPASVAFLFPGVGDQYPGMGRGLYEAEPVFRAEVDRCAEILRPRLGFDLREALFADDGERDARPASGGIDLRRMVQRAPASGAAERLSRTEVAQPAAFVVGYALARLWASRGVRPAALLGHSLGEYTAACVAGVFRLEDALELVALRAQAIQALPGGTMLAVPLPADALGPFLGDGAALAAVNAPALSVLAGPEEAIARAERRLADAGHATRRLAASHAFHSPEMRPVAERVAALAAGMTLSEPRIPMISNVTGTWLTAAQATDPGYWARHLVGTVRFADGAATLLREPGRVLVEAGPGASLATFVRMQAAADGSPAPAWGASLPHAAEDTPEPVFLRASLERLRTAGVALDAPPSPESPESPIAEPPADAEAGAGAGDRGGRAAEEGGPVARMLAGVWHELLGAEPSLDDDFFLVGGHSLAAARLIGRVREAFGVEMRLRTLFQTRTVAGMARWIEDAVQARGPSPAAPSPTPGIPG